MEEGFLRLSRRFFSNELWNAAREFSECEAWLDILQSACYGASGQEARKGRLIGVREVSYTRGQYPASVSFLKKRWGWNTEKRVRCFLDKLRKKGMITTDSTQGINVITVCNYDKYNPVPHPEGQAQGQAQGQAKGKDSPLTHNDLQEFGASLGASIRAEVGAMLREFAAGMPANAPKQGQAKGNNKKKEEESSMTTTELNPKKETSPDGEAKKDGLSLTETDKNKIDWQALMDYYNATFQGKLPVIKAMTDARKKAVKSRVAQYGKDAVMQVFSHVLESPFLLGDNDRNWTADFDWIFKPANFTKILERRYNGKRTDTNQTRRESRKILNGLAAEILAADAAKDSL